MDINLLNAIHVRTIYMRWLLKAIDINLHLLFPHLFLHCWHYGSVYYGLVYIIYPWSSVAAVFIINTMT